MNRFTRNSLVVKIFSCPCDEARQTQCFPQRSTFSSLLLLFFFPLLPFSSSSSSLFSLNFRLLRRSCPYSVLPVCLPHQLPLVINSSSSSSSIGSLGSMPAPSTPRRLPRLLSACPIQYRYYGGSSGGLALTLSAGSLYAHPCTSQLDIKLGMKIPLLLSYYG